MWLPERASSVSDFTTGHYGFPSGTQCRILSIIVSTDSLQAETKPLKLGFISILTGSYSDVGQAMAKAAELATEDYQREHPQRSITFILEDDAHDPKKAMSAYLKLSEVDKADLIMPISTFAIGALKDRLNTLY